MGWLTKDRSVAKQSRSEALACIPVKNRHVREQRLDSGELVVLYPVTVRPWMALLAVKSRKAVKAQAKEIWR
jgi:hypothetical protein